MKEKKIAAFFDIDGTIYRDSLMVEHFRTLLDFDLMVSEKHATQAYKDWYKRQGDYEDYLDAVSKVYVEELKNLTKTDVEFTGRYVIKKKSDRVYKFTRSMLQKHKKEGHLVIFISGSPDFLVKNMAKKLKLLVSSLTNQILLVGSEISILMQCVHHLHLELVHGGKIHFHTI